MARGVEGSLDGLPTSQWYDVPANQPGTHLQADQITCLRDKLERLTKAGVRPDNIIAISPFRTIANELARLTDDFPGITAGTVHTAQGREADVVFLVLGGDPRKPGAKRWASCTPNLVNVAVSRAKRRLYVIGDRQEWAQHPFFDTTAAHLGTESSERGSPTEPATRGRGIDNSGDRVTGQPFSGRERK